MKETKKIQKAKQLAKDLHKTHTRLNGDNYYDHVLRVYEWMIRLGVKDEDILIASLLHQALSFSSEVLGEINRVFGEEVTSMVEGYQNLSDTKIVRDSKGKFNEKYIVQTYMNLAKDMRVLLIRLVDKVDNIETAYALPKKQRKDVGMKALNIYAPIARLLGIMEITKALEDGAFKLLYPRQYYQIAKTIEERMPEMETLFKEAKPVLTELFEEAGIKAEIKSRVKHIYGIHKKIVKYAGDGKKIGKNYESILDIAGIRVLVDTEDQCYTASNIMRQLWEEVPGEYDDYISSPKASGYKSIHNTFRLSPTVNFEIQVRTHEMHDHNEYGGASHVFYKIGENFKKNLEEDPNWVKKLQQWEIEKNLKKQEAKIEHFRENVYCFSPKGDIIELPHDATVLDFAYAIHAELGHSCVGAFVNGEIKKLNHVVGDGDNIEIKTVSTRSDPSQSWLGFVKTSKARSAIRKKLKLTNRD